MPTHTAGSLARELGVSLFAIQRLVAKLNLAPVARAGNVRLFSADAAARVRQEIERRRAK